MSCEEVALYLGKDPDSNPMTERPPYDPTDMFTANTCNVVIVWTDAPFGEYSESSPLDFRESFDPIATIACTLGDGSFTETEFGGSAGYYWINETEPNAAHWFTGRVAWGELTRLEQVSDGVEVDAEIDLIDGLFPLSSDAETATPRGTGKGTIVAPSPDLADSDFFVQPIGACDAVEPGPPPAGRRRVRRSEDGVGERISMRGVGPPYRKHNGFTGALLVHS